MWTQKLLTSQINLKSGRLFVYLHCQYGCLYSLSDHNEFEVSSGFLQRSRDEILFVLLRQMRNPWGTHTCHFEFPHQYLVYWHFWHVQEACQCSNRQMSIIFNMEAMVLVLISVTKVLGLPYHDALWTDFRQFLNSLYQFLMLELLRHSSLKAFISNIIISLGIFSRWMQNLMPMCCLVFEFFFFLATRTTLCLVCSVFFLPVCKNEAIDYTTFVLLLNNEENIPLSDNIVVVRVLFNHVPPPPSKDTDCWLTEVSH